MVELPYFPSTSALLTRFTAILLGRETPFVSEILWFDEDAYYSKMIFLYLSFI